MPVFSLITATVGRVDELYRLIDTLAGQTCSDFEWIIVDQNPDGRLLSVVEYATAKGIVTQHLRSSRRGLSLARNIGLKHCQGNIVAFPDDDCWYEPDTLIQVHQQFQLKKKLAGIVARWHEQDPADLPSVTLNWQQWRRFRGITASSITIFLDKALVDQVGGFDEALGVPLWFSGGEETDLMFRVLASSRQVITCPNIIVHHPVTTGETMLTTAESFRRARHRSRGTGALYAKHNLAAWVILRGLLSPLWNISPPFSKQRLAWQLGMWLGRAEGYLSWHCGRILRRRP